MLVGKEIKNIFNQLAGGDTIHVPCDGSEIRVQILDHSQLSLTTLVYEGGNYIPPSVRSCVSRRSPFFHPCLLTFLTIDEQNFQIKLQYVGHPEMNQQQLCEVLEEFGLIASKWRIYLEDHDKHDLIYVRAK